MTSILVIGDGHTVAVDKSTKESYAATNNERFKGLGNYILDKKPEVIISMGDFMDMSCFSAWDQDKREIMDGQRYANEVLSANQALDWMEAPLLRYNQMRKKNKKGPYSPRKIFIEGNHEDRLRRYLERDPRLKGVIGVVKDLDLERRGWEFVPYQEYVYLEGIGFTHIPHNSGNGKPISGINICRKAHMVCEGSVVFGHTHRLEYGAFSRTGGLVQHVLSAGMFFDHTPHYIGKTPNPWFSGVVWMDTLGDGDFDFEKVSLNKIYEYM